MSDPSRRRRTYPPTQTPDLLAWDSPPTTISLGVGRVSDLETESLNPRVNPEKRKTGHHTSTQPETRTTPHNARHDQNTTTDHTKNTRALGLTR